MSNNSQTIYSICGHYLQYKFGVIDPVFIFKKEN